MNSPTCTYTWLDTIKLSPLRLESIIMIPVILQMISTSLLYFQTSSNILLFPSFLFIVILFSPNVDSTLPLLFYITRSINITSLILYAHPAIQHFIQELLQAGVGRVSFVRHVTISDSNKQPPYDTIQNTQVLHSYGLWFFSASGITITDTSPVLAFSANEKTVFQFWKTVIMSFVYNSTKTYLEMLFPLIWIVLQSHRVR